VYPNKEQKEKLNMWFGTARWTYNQVVAAIQSGTKLSKKDLRATCVNNTNFKGNKQWVTKTPYDIRDEAMNDVLKAYSTNFALKRKNFTIGFRSKKAMSQSIAILGKHWKSSGIFHPTFWGKHALKSSEPLPTSLEYDSRLIRTKLGHYYLCIPQPLELTPEKQGGQKSLISIDPGARTFATGYDPKGYMFEWGKSDISRIYRLCHNMDKLHSKIDGKEVIHKKRYKLKKAALRIRGKIRNLIDEFHKKFSLWLCRNYSVILLPSFNTSQMVSRIKRRIRKKTVRQMLTWSHYRFRQRY
jgi:putative transposase